MFTNVTRASWSTVVTVAVKQASTIRTVTTSSPPASFCVTPE